MVFGTFLFILESIGTQELVLIGMVALIFLGPRQLPQIARKIGRIMSDFRSTTQEFKSTWEREVNFEEEERVLRSAFEDDQPEPAAPENSILPPTATNQPEIKEIDPAIFKKSGDEAAEAECLQTTENKPPIDLEAKQNWL